MTSSLGRIIFFDSFGIDEKFLLQYSMGRMKKNILLVEDDVSIREVIEEFLQEEGVSVHGSANGQEALDYLHTHEELPDLILLDLMMPLKNGLQFRQEQLQDPRLASIPTLLMTAEGEIEPELYHLSPEEILHKPLDISDLIKVVNG